MAATIESPPVVLLRATSDIAASIIPACAAIAGTAVAGLFAAWTQRAARAADQARWDRENRARFHETRLKAYTEFLEQASNATRVILDRAIERHGQPAEPDKLAGLTVTVNQTDEGPEFNRDAPRRMTRRQNVVMMLTSSADVRDAATKLVNGIISIAAVPIDDPNWNGRLMEILTRNAMVHDRFVAAARAELNS